MNNEAININLRIMEPYINALNKYLRELCEEQSGINQAFNKVTEVWRDKISGKTGEILTTANKAIENINDTLSSVIAVENRRAEHLSEKYIVRHWNAVFEKSSVTTRLKREEKMDIDHINGTTVEGIKAFEKALNNYIENTLKNLKLILSEHDAVHRGWNDAQYKKTTDKINEFSADLKRQLDVLANLKDLIQARRKQFEIALGIK